MPTVNRGRPALPIEAAWLGLGVLAILALAVWRCSGGGAPAAEDTPATSATSTTSPQPFAPCGVEEPGEGNAFDVEARACLLDAVASGGRVEFETARTTVEGASIYYRVRVLGSNDFEVTVDNRADEFSGPARRRVTTTRCSTLEQADPDRPLLLISGCADGSSYEV